MTEFTPKDGRIIWDVDETSNRQISWNESIITWALFALVIWSAAANMGFSDVSSCIAGDLIEK